ncbi:MAG TPA: type II toxin-antitoxin system prevent-host-death family antitoxin [Vicinamibacterales bacterium]|jgi:prevent-host-death family protein|nr:type II toxin-antitoxin system prevent-host-death family antitoxin [Vicinamibacterales bacterium]
MSTPAVSLLVEAPDPPPTTSHLPRLSWSSKTTNEVTVSQFNIAEAKARFSELVEKALAGDEVIVARDHKPLLKLVPIEPARARTPGSAAGAVWMSDDFDAPVPDFAAYEQP